MRIDCDSHFLPKDIFDDVDPEMGTRRPRLWFDAMGRSVITYIARTVNHCHYRIITTFTCNRSGIPI